ncbi:MAG: HlyD family secretion protein, partial [Polaribacter sp.]
KIFNKDSKDKITKGSPFFFLKSTSDYTEIQKLKRFLEDLKKDSILKNALIIPKNFRKLGVLQNSYNQLTTYLKEYNEHIEYHPYQKRIVFLEKIIVGNKQSLQSAKTGFLLELQDQKIMEKDKERSDSLFSKGVISERDYGIAQQRFLQKEIQIENIRTTLIDKNASIVNLQKQLAELKIQQNDFNYEIRDHIKNTIKTLNSQIAQWTTDFVISAPINGTISIFKELNKGDYLSAGSYLLTMLPLENQELFAYGSFSVAKAGKLKKNSKAIIKLHSYPYREYGSIDGFIEKISDFPIKEMYSVKIRLPNKLETGYDKKIIFKQRLSGDAELITENRSLLSRIFSNFKYFIKKSVKEE